MLAQFNIVHFHIYSYFVISSLSVSAVLDPLVTIYYVSPYRRFARKCLRLSTRDSDSTQRAASFSYDKSSSVRRSPASTSIRRSSSYKFPAIL
ncbi:hypothetical protein OESDEN_17888 [Oesophagostomum dentatum]|uniref:Uncharacterized protein n=1 Tax=Oesophagostomum dentatum TaxID=61180 RepID=A0A0B1SAT3_OESDE|nr:hypothetical protein OESDEN_17888 [Oesophagostomum dentatum]